MESREAIKKLDKPTCVDKLCEEVRIQVAEIESTYKINIFYDFRPIFVFDQFF